MPLGAQEPHLLEAKPSGFHPSQLWKMGQAFLKRHGRKLWWLHSIYALGLGVMVMFFAQKGVEYAHYSLGLLVIAWLLLVVLFQIFGSGASRQLEGTPQHVGYYALTYILKNLHQAMLFFCLPFYWKSATLGSPNQIYLLILGLCALLSTLDVVFDNILMKWRLAASTFYAFILFSCLVLIIPAIAPSLPSFLGHALAAAFAVTALWTFYRPLFFTRREPALRVAASIAGAILLVLVARPVIPPVPAHMSWGAITPSLLPNGAPSHELKAIHHSQVESLVALSEVTFPAGHERTLYHRWMAPGMDPVEIEAEDLNDGIDPTGARVMSQMPKATIGAIPEGLWRVEILTGGGQLLGRLTFEVTD